MALLSRSSVNNKRLIMYIKVSTLTFTWSMSQDARGDTPSQLMKRMGKGFFLFVNLLSRQGF
jgi:hypothetical protein